jgi:hypothetical protein
VIGFEVVVDVAPTDSPPGEPPRPGTVWHMGRVSLGDVEIFTIPVALSYAPGEWAEAHEDVERAFGRVLASLLQGVEP